MIATLLRISWLTLKRDRVALAITFVLPIIFFSVFAAIFGGMGGSDSLAEIRVVVVDEDDTETSRRFAEALAAEESLRGPAKGDEQPMELATRAEARQLVEAGKADAAVILAAGFASSFGDFGGGATETASTLILADTAANPVAHQVMQGLLQKIAMTAAPDLLLERGMGLLGTYGGGLTAEQESVLEQFRQMSSAEEGVGGSEASGLGNGMNGGLVQVAIEDVRRQDDSKSQRQRMVAFQAAGIGVMFLLFAMSAAAGTLLREEQTGTLERLLGSRVGMGTLLASHWLFAALLGFVQVSLMFVWGWAVFGLDLWTPEHLAGFAVMTSVTAAAASAFGLVLGTAARSQAQLSGLSTIVVLLMSALGGSMFPRFLMRQNPVLDTLGLATFNAWAIDGYQKVFWYQTGLASLWPQVLVLMLLTAVCLTAARFLARRWESV